VLGFSQMLLERENVPADIKESVAMIADGSQRVADIVKKAADLRPSGETGQELVESDEIIENTLEVKSMF